MYVHDRMQNSFDFLARPSTGVLPKDEPDSAGSTGHKRSHTYAWLIIFMGPIYVSYVKEQLK